MTVRKKVVKGGARVTFAEFISALLGAEMSFADLGREIAAFFADLAVKPGAESVFGFFSSGLARGEVVLPTVFFLLSLFMTLFGKRMLSLLRFIAFFALGYVLGVAFLVPAVNAVFPSFAPWIIAMTAAIVLSVLSKPLYFAAYVLVFGTLSYVLVGNALGAGTVPSAVAALALVALALIFRKYFEMLYTSLLGAFLMCKAIMVFWDFTAFSALPWIPLTVVTMVLGLVGALVQFRTRQKL